MSRALSSIDLIDVFLAVMSEGSLTGAAHSLGRSQPTVRRQIERLESDLGLTLFTRSPNGLIPTQTAQALLKSARKVESNAAAFERAASATADRLSGTVRVTCPRLFAAFHLPALISELRKEHAEIQIELAADDRVENLLEREADIAIRLTAPAQLALVAKKLAPIDLGLFAAPELADQHSYAQSIEELLQRAPFIWSDLDPSYDQAAAALGIDRPRHLALRTDDQIVQIHAMKAGVGVGLCQARIASLLGLVRLVPQWSHTLPAWVVMHEDQSKIRRVRHIFDHLVNALGANKEPPLQ